MKIIFCLSYLSVPTTMSIIESSDEDFLIVTSNKMLDNFFKRLYPREKIFLLKSTPLISKNPLQTIYNLYFIHKYKKEILVKFNRFQNIGLFFFFVAFCEFESWVVKQLSISNNIYYKQAVSIDHLQRDYSIQGWVGKLIRKIIYSIDFIPLKTGNHKYYKISPKFSQQIDAKPFILDINNKLVSKKLNDHLKEFRNSKILILCGWVAEVFVKMPEYIRKVDAVLKLLENAYGYDALAIKTHPQRPEYYSKEKTLKKIPSDIPANLLLNHFDVVIGYDSATLIEAANAGKKAISLLRLMDPIDPDVRDSFIIYLENNATKAIYYPESSEELFVITEKK